MHTAGVRNSLALLIATAALPLLAADVLGVKTGLWEVTTTTTTSGMSIPADTAAALSPAQRAQMAKALQELGAAGPVTRQEKSCITAKDLQQGALWNKSADGTIDCKYTQVRGGVKHQEFTFQCPAEAGNASGKMVVHAVDSTHLTGSMEMKSAQLSMSSKFESKWLGASCSG